MTEAQADELLSKPESESLDFKTMYATENASTVHDIACLSNPLSDSDKFIVLGVHDKTWTVTGIENDPNRKTQADIMQILYNAKFNHMSRVTVHTFKRKGHEIDVIRIHNLTDKPYFLTKDYRSGSKTVRAGVLYTRNGDTNTPIDGTADDAQIEKMYRERLGIDKPPLQRALIYLRDTKNWKYGHDQNRMYFYYDP